MNIKEKMKNDKKDYETGTGDRTDRYVIPV